MIITRSPLRISLGGGGTDLPSYYREHGGFLVAAAIDILGEPIGKQDQYIAAYGGLTCFEFHPGGEVSARPLKISQETLYNLEDDLLLFFTGYSRSASAILKDQDARSKGQDKAMID